MKQECLLERCEHFGGLNKKKDTDCYGVYKCIKYKQDLYSTGKFLVACSECKKNGDNVNG